MASSAVPKSAYPNPTRRNSGLTKAVLRTPATTCARGWTLAALAPRDRTSSRPGTSADDVHGQTVPALQPTVGARGTPPGAVRAWTTIARSFSRGVMRTLRHDARIAGPRGRRTGCGAAWLARLTGGQEVPGSNPGSPTHSRFADSGFLAYPSQRANCVDCLFVIRHCQVEGRAARGVRRRPERRSGPGTSWAIHQQDVGVVLDRSPSVPSAVLAELARTASSVLLGGSVPNGQRLAGSILVWPYRG